MSNLTWALAILGGLVLAALVLHNVWQARRTGPKRASAPVGRVEPQGDLSVPAMSPRVAGSAPPSPPQGPRWKQPAEAMLDQPADPLPGPLGDAPAGEAASHAAGPGAAPAGLAPLSRAESALDGQLPSQRRPLPRLDPLVDAMAAISLDAPVSGDFLLQHLPGSRRAGSKPMMVEGLDAETGEWDAPRAGRRYSELQAGVQLANRTGALNEIEYSEFAQKVQAFTEAVGGMADLPDMLEMVARARELDAFASRHDAQLAVRLRARAAAWSVGYIQQHAGRHGFVPGPVPGRLVLPSRDDGGPPVLTLTYDSQAALADDPNQAALHDVTLSFDVPQTELAVAPFDAWRASSQALAGDMEAVIVDDVGRPLHPQAFASIGTDLQQLYQALDARGLPAGSMAARRLFS